MNPLDDLKERLDEINKKNRELGISKGLRYRVLCEDFVLLVAVYRQIAIKLGKNDSIGMPFALEEEVDEEAEHIFKTSREG